MQRHNVLSIDHHQKLYTAKEALAFFERDSEDETSSLSSSSSSSETGSDESLKINKVRCTLVPNKIKNMSKIPESHNSKDSVTFVMTSHEAKCITLETSVSKKWGESLQPRTPEYSKKTTPKVVSDKCVTSKTSVSNTFKGGEPLQPSGQKSSRKTTPKVVSDKCVTSKTSVSNTCKGGEPLQPSGQKSSRKTTPKVVSDKCVTSKTSVSKKCGESLPLSGQKSSKKTTPKAAVSIHQNPAKSKRLTSEAHSKLLHSTCKTKCNTNKSDNSLLSSSTSTSFSHEPSITIDLDIDANDVSVSSDTQEPTGDILTLLHDVQDLQPLEFPETDQEPNNEIQNDIENESESSLGGDSDMENNYVIEIEEQGHNLERTSCTQYQHDVDLESDVNS